MKKIVLIDDQSYGLASIKKLHTHEEYTLDYYDTVKEFLSIQKQYDICYLDYYLDKDGITGDSVVHKIKKYCSTIIGFSSTQKGCEKIVEAGAERFILKVFS
jgi:DNA-binding response OmpR family regulator